MSRLIKCDKCGGEVDPERIGYVSLLQRKDGDDDELGGKNPFENMDFCADCMELIADFVTKKVPKRGRKTKRQKTAEKQKKARVDRRTLDTGKIRALHECGWTQEKIAEEMHCSTSTINKVLREIYA